MQIIQQTGTVSQTYRCKNVGCDGERNFEGAPEAWFQERDLSPPTNCSDCRAWKRAQVDTIFIRCQACGEDWKITAKYRISYHRNEGNWDQYAASLKGGKPCGRCARNPYRIAKAHQASARMGYAAYSEKPSTAIGTATKNGFIEDVDQIGVPVDPLLYCKMAYRGRDSWPNEYAHITNPEHGFDKMGMYSGHDILETLGGIAASTSPHIMQCRSGREIIKADLHTSVVVVLTQHGTNGEWRIRTGYVSDNFDKFLQKKCKTESWHK